MKLLTVILLVCFTQFLRTLFAPLALKTPDV